MSEKNKVDATNAPDPELPAFVKAAPELIPLWDWWVKEGKSTLAYIAAAALAVAGFYAVRNWQESRVAAANAALTGAYTTEELESAVASFGSTKTGPALRLRLAKSYYDAERYQDALGVYETLAKDAKGNAAFVDVAEVGKAYALEGDGKFAEAGAAFAAFAADPAKEGSPLLLTAKLGAARCKALQGDKDGAAKDFEALKEAAKDDELAKMRIERMADAVKRHDPSRAARSLFDAADAAEAAIQADAAAKPADAEAKPAETPAAPAPAAPAQTPAQK